MRASPATPWQDRLDQALVAGLVRTGAAICPPSLPSKPDLAPDLVPLRFVSHRSRGVMSRLIRWQTDAGPDGPSHTSYIDDADRLWEAREWRGTVQERTLLDAQAAGDRTELLTVYVTREAKARAEAYAAHGVAARWRYWYGGIARFLRRGTAQPPADKKFCSQFCDEIAWAAGVTVSAEPSWMVTPAEFRNSPVWQRAALAPDAPEVTP